MALMLCPVRCFSCGSEVCWKHEQYRAILQEGKDGSQKALDRVGAWRMCCRRMILGQPSHFALMKEALAPAPNISSDSFNPMPQAESSDNQNNMQNIETMMIPEIATKLNDGDDDEEDDDESDVDIES